MDVTTSTVIARPVEQVAAYAADPARAPEWYENIVAVEWVTAPPLAVGTRVAFVARFLGRRLAYTYEIREWLPNRRLVMSTAEGPFPMETTYEWRALSPNTTEMRLRNRGRASGFPALLMPFMGIFVRMANRKDLARLKRILETHQPADAQPRLDD